MIIELKGVGFTNKGAELMLYCIMDALKMRDPSVVFAVEPIEPFPRRAHLGLYQKIWENRKGIPFDTISNALPKRILKDFGCVNSNNLNAYFDVSGFAYSDQWGRSIAQRAADKVKKYHKKGIKIILFPQSFGPFEDQNIAHNTRVICENADLIFAREETSYEHLSKILPNMDKVTLCPDFTIAAPAEVTNIPDRYKDALTIVPNRRVTDKRDDMESFYIDYLSKAILHAAELGVKSQFVIFENKRDKEIAKAVMQKINRELPVIADLDAHLLKGIIGSSRALITSRYHALICGLTQEIPCLTLGWSHKYSDVMKEYKLHNCSINIADMAEAVDRYEQMIHNLFDDSFRQDVQRKMKKRNYEVAIQIEGMWHKINAMLDI